MSNFDFLKVKYPDLAKIGSFAEEYYESDPVSSIAKLRMFAEFISKKLCVTYIGNTAEASFSDLLSYLRDHIEPKFLDIFHIIRLKGNKAAHENIGTIQDALILIKHAYDISIWFYVLETGDKEAIKPFKKPVSRLIKLEKELQELSQKYKQIEENLKNNIVELEKYKLSKEKSEEKIKELERESKKAELVTAQISNYNEAETRRYLIDEIIKEAGWDINPVDLETPSPQIKAFDTDQVKREVPVTGLPNTPSGNGYVDYVFYNDDGKPIAILEAKKTTVNVEKGQEQARQYANVLEKMTNFRPLIFFTNGYDIYVWDDASYAKRKIYGLFSKEDVETRLFQRENRKELEKTKIDTDIINRPYQIEAVRRTYESFTVGKRRGLIVMATGTGKTRTAMAIIDGLIKSNWIKRVLFLVDRDELRKQANNAFKKHLDFLSRILIDSSNRSDQNKRVYIATYPTMLNAYSLYTPGFFDLIIADESHRSIYNVYGEIFKYFDAFQIGLTATPVNYISRNTFQLFDTDDNYPTFNYDLDDAIEEKHLVPYKVRRLQTGFLDRGIKYDQLTQEQKKALEEQLEEYADSCNFEANDIEVKITNKETNRKILKSLMDEGLRDENGNLGKTIIFARSHKHAVILEELFNDMYPEYKGKYARVIDSHDPNASILLDNFKGEADENDINIAISVSMLDTGVDVPEILNLVFAKPVYSKVKFWQMIGRGTRLCKNLLAPGKDKTHFLIFDHYDNFEFFGENPEGYEPKEQLSLYERLFQARLKLAELAKELNNTEIFENTLRQLKNDISSLPQKSVDVMDKAALINEIMTTELFWQNFDNKFVSLLLHKIRPLMKRHRTGFEMDKALQFDIQIVQLQIIHLEKQLELANTTQGKKLEELSKKMEFFRSKVRKNAFELRININKVHEKIDLIEKIKDKDWSKDFNYRELEQIREELRLLMKYKVKLPVDEAIEIDIPDDVEIDEYIQLKMDFSFGEEYKHDIESLLNKLASENIVLQKIKKGKTVTNTELDSLISIILEQNPHFSTVQLEKLYPETANNLNLLIRNIIGIDEEEINARIGEFVKKNTTLSSLQLKCLELIKNKLKINKYLRIESLYDKPFTSIDPKRIGVEGIFSRDQVRDIYRILDGFILD